MEQLTIAQRLTRFRKEASLSQAAVAEALSVSRQAISKWESGKAEPALSFYAILAALYGVTLDEIFLGYQKDTDPDTAPTATTFHERLCEIRSKKGFSQSALAEALAISRQAVSKWESGKAEPDADHLTALCELFDISLAWLLPSADKTVLSATPKKASEKKEVRLKSTASSKDSQDKAAVPAKHPIASDAPTPTPTKATTTKKEKADPLPAPANPALSRRNLLRERVRRAGQKERGNLPKKK